MGYFAQEIGSEIGSLAGGYIGGKYKHKEAGKKIGSLVGKFAGSYIPFEKGGLVKPPRGKKTQIIVAHKNELIIPAHLTKHISKSLKNKIKRNGGRNMQ